MHYVIGTEIVVEKRHNKVKIKPGMSSSQLRQNLKRSKYENVQSEFEPGRVYTLSRIYKAGDGIVYRFTDGLDRTEVMFDTTQDADEFISELRKENVPDYEEVYRRMTH